MSNLRREYHLLKIEDYQGQRLFHLKFATYTIGRDPNVAIQVDDPNVSRHQALLLRFPSGRDRYAFRVVDGDADGMASRNGTLVNGQVCRSKTLEHGDTIQIGTITSISYLITNWTEEEFRQHVSQEDVAYQPIKCKVVDPRGTLVVSETIL